MLTINGMGSADLQILNNLDVLAQEARKHKSVEEFGFAIAVKRTTMQVRQVKQGIGFRDELIGGISQRAFSTAETIQQLEEVLKRYGYSSLRDFYDQATKVNDSAE